MDDSKINIRKILQKKKEGEKITAITAYDYTFAKMADESGIDIILVGDSLGMVLLGYPSTVYVTLNDMLHHLKAVKRAVKRSYIVCDMPFLSYHTGWKDAVKNAGKLIQEGGADAIKVEGGTEIVDIIRKISDVGIPVVGHIGLNPQKILKTGGYYIQREEKELINSALQVQDAGAFLIVMECVPESIAKKVTESLNIPTIGIGAGKFTDGQILVINDLLGINFRPLPKFVKKYEDFFTKGKDAIKKYIRDVKNGIFPGKENVYD